MLETVNYERFVDNMYRNAAWKLEPQFKDSWRIMEFLPYDFTWK